MMDRGARTAEAAPSRSRGGDRERQPFGFSSFPPQRGIRWRQVAASSAIHVFVLVVTAGLSAIAVHELPVPDQDVVVSFVEEEPPEELVPIVPTPAAPKRAVVPRPHPAPTLLRLPPPPEVAPREVPKPKTPPPPVEPARHERPRVGSAGFDRPKPPEAPPATREVRTEIFSEGSSAAPTLDAPVRKVQTGGFGDPDGFHATKTTRRPGALPKFGSFDLPVGPGHGNGAGGASGLRGTVASAGFGDGIATQGKSGGAASGKGVRQAGFAEATGAPEPRKTPRRASGSEAPMIPVEIVSKPRPAYTEEARRRHLEGEVVLEVLFSSTGRTRVLRVVKGLGFGLDESAVRAAEQILFKPARQDGLPVDYTAVVRMVFQLA